MEILVVMCPQNDKISGPLGSQEAVSIVPRICDYIESFDGIVLNVLDCNTDGVYETTPEANNHPIHCIANTYGFNPDKNILNSIKSMPFDNLLTYLKERKARDDAERAEKIANGIPVENPLDFTDYENGYKRTFYLYQHTTGVICHYFWDYNEAHQDDPIEKITFIGYCTDEAIYPFVNYIRTYMPATVIAIDGSCCAGTTPELHNKALRALKEKLFVIENWTDPNEEEENDFIEPEYPVYIDPAEIFTNDTDGSGE